MSNKRYYIARNLSAYIANIIALPPTIILGMGVLTIVYYRSLDGSSTIHYPWQVWKNFKDEL